MNERFTIDDFLSRLDHRESVLDIDEIPCPLPGTSQVCENEGSHQGETECSCHTPVVSGSDLCQPERARAPSRGSKVRRGKPPHPLSQVDSSLVSSGREVDISHPCGVTAHVNQTPENGVGLPSESRAAWGKSEGGGDIPGQELFSDRPSD
jgi:hypothetical protein